MQVSAQPILRPQWSCAVTQPITPSHALIIVTTFGFTGWLITRGEDPWAALLFALAALAGTVTVIRASWRGAVAVLRRLTSST